MATQNSGDGALPSTLILTSDNALEPSNQITLNHLEMNEMTSDVIKLADGAAMPAVGLGLWKIDRPAAADAVVRAIRAGYRHFDSACDYGNEAEIGDGLAAAHQRQALPPRRSLDHLEALEHVSRPSARAAGARADPSRPEARLSRPVPDPLSDRAGLCAAGGALSAGMVPRPGRRRAADGAGPRAALRNVAGDGRGRPRGARAANRRLQFQLRLLRDLLAYGSMRPAVLQVELHPYLAQEKLVRFCREEGIAATGFSPLGAASYVSLGMAPAGDSVLSEPAIVEAARRHGKSPAQIALRWGVQRGTAVIPKTTRPERLAENLAIFDFSLSDDEMRAIGRLDRGRRFNDPGVFGEAAFHTFMPIYD